MGKRIGVQLTKRVVDAALPSEKRHHVWDSELAGFGLRIEPTGVKTFIAKYRSLGGGRSATQRVVTIGRLGPLTPDQARKQAKIILGGAAAGSDPAAELQAKRREMTMSALIDLYEAKGCVIQRGKRQGVPMKPRTKAYTMARLRHHALPLLGHRKAPEINAGDIERFVSDVASGRTARDEKVGPRQRIIVRGGEGAARKVVRDLSAVFSFALRSEVVQRNPCETAAVRKTDNQNERFLTLEEVTRLGAALDVLERQGVNRKATNIARLWAFTGCRRDEIAGLKWSEVDTDRGFLQLAETKSGRSFRPLGAAAISLLKSLSKQEDSDFVFPGERGDGHYQGTKGVWSRAVLEAKLPGVSPHPRCYMRATADCSEKISGEHYVSASILAEFPNLRVTGLPWFGPGETRTSVKALQSKILCTRHNSALSPLDVEGKRMLVAIRDSLNHVWRKSLSKRTLYRIVSGEGFELWGLKTLMGLLEADAVRTDGQSTAQRFTIPDALITRALTDGALPPGYGLYVGHESDILHDTIGFAPLTHQEDQRVAGLRISFLGIVMDFILDPNVAALIVRDRDPYLRPAVLDFDGKDRASRIILTRGDQRTSAHRVSFSMRFIPTTAAEADEHRDRWARKQFERAPRTANSREPR